MTKPRASAHVRTKKLVDNPRLGGTGQGLNAHIMVAKEAVALAEVFFEVYAAENTVYRRLRAGGRVTEADARRFFVQRVAPTLLEEARKKLADYLSEDDAHVPPAMKEEIYEALLLDNDLRANRFVSADRAHVPVTMH